MADLQARIGPKATKLYPNLTWKRPGTDLQSPTKNTVNWSETRQSDEKEDDSDASSHTSSQTFPSPIKSRSDHPNNTSRPRRPPSLLTRMGLASDLPEDSASDGADAASVQQSLLARVGTTEDTPPSSYPSLNIGSTSRDPAHVLGSNGYDDINSKHAQRSSPQPSLPSSSNDKGNAFIAENQPFGNGGSLYHPDSGQMKCNDGLVVKPPTKEASSSEFPHKSILHDSSKSNYTTSNVEISTTPSLKDNLAPEKNLTLPNFPTSQEQEFEEGQLVDSEPLPSQRVRDLLLPLVLKNAAYREKEGDSDLSRHSAYGVLSDEVCSSFMDQMKEVRTEMHANKNRSSHNLAQTQPTSEANNSGAAHASLLKIGQAPPSGPRAMKYTRTGKYMPPHGEIATKPISLKDLPQPISASSSHFHEPVSPSIHRRREPGFRRTPSLEHGEFHDHNRGRPYSQHRHPRPDGQRSHSRSHSPSRHSRGQPYHRPSRDRARSRSPVTLVTSPRSRSPLSRQRRSPSVADSRPRYFRDRAIRESPDDILDRPHRYDSPPGTSSYDRIPKRRRSLSRDVRRIEGNTSPRWDPADSVQSPISPSSHRHFGRSPFTHDRGPGLDESPRHRRDSHVSIVRPGFEFARRSASPPRRKQHRQLSAERPLPRTSPRPTTPNPYGQSTPKRTSPRHSPQPTTPNPDYPSTPNPYCQSPRNQASFGQSHREEGMGSLSPGAGSMSRHLTETSDLQEPGLNVLPCHNVPGVWFVKVALDNIGTLECSFEVDKVTALKWNLQHTNSKRMWEEKLQLQICCLSQKLVQSVMESLKPDATAQDVATALFTIQNDWPTPGHLIIMVNPQEKNKRVWLPDKLEPPHLPVCIEDCVFEGQNIVQFIQLSGMSERMFVLFATARPLLDGLQHGDHEGFVPAPLQNTIDGGKGDTFEIGVEVVYHI